MTYPPKPEPRGELPPPRRRPPTALGAALLPPEDNPQRSSVVRQLRQSWLPRAVDSLFRLLDRIGEDLAGGLRLRRPHPVPKPR